MLVLVVILDIHRKVNLTRNLIENDLIQGMENLVLLRGLWTIWEEKSQGVVIYETHLFEKWTQLLLTFMYIHEDSNFCSY